MNKNIIWTVEGKVKIGNRERLDALMQEMVETVRQEEGTLNYEWALAEDESSLHVYERYKDAEAATAHLATWGLFAERFMAIVDITRFVVFSNLTQELKEAVAGLNPVIMTPIGGFAK